MNDPVNTDFIYKNMYKNKETVSAYAKYRPEHSPEIYEAIIKFCDKGGTDRKMALDVACGPGKTTNALVPYFEKVIGMDISQIQVDQARHDFPELNFQTGTAEDLSFLEDASVDLITCGQAFHYLEKEKFLKEADRVLKPRGALAVFSYFSGHMVFENEEFDAFLKGIFDPMNVEAQKIPAIAELDSKYVDYRFSWDEMERDTSINIYSSQSIEEYLGTLKSAGKAYKDAMEAMKVTDVVTAKVKELFTKADGTEIPIKCIIPETLLLGRKAADSAD